MLRRTQLDACAGPGLLADFLNGHDTGRHPFVKPIEPLLQRARVASAEGHCLPQAGPQIQHGWTVARGYPCLNYRVGHRSYLLAVSLPACLLEFLCRQRRELEPAAL
jgi:hypothetical protein